MTVSPAPERTNGPPPESIPARPVRLDCVSVSAWGRNLPGADDGYGQIADLDAPGALKQIGTWRAKRATVWVELAMPEDPDHWFEGSVDPWTSMQPPRIDWTNAEPVLKELELVPDSIAEIDTDSEAQVRIIALLPHLYAFGVARIRRETLRREKLDHEVGDELLFFPTVGFDAARDARPENGPPDTVPGRLPSFWTIRTAIAVIGKVVLSVRLPDYLCTPDPSSDPCYRSPLGRDLRLPRRFLAGRFPGISYGPEALDVAEGIAVHHAATARAVAERARNALRGVELTAGHLDSHDGSHAREDGERPDPRRALAELERIAEIAQQVDRQLDRSLRRLTDYGNREELVAGQARVRFRYALDEIRGLRKEVATTRTAIAAHMQGREQNDREKFQLLAALLASAILIPTLVAAVYGANVTLPSKESWGGLKALLLFIFSFSIFGVLLVAEFWSRNWVLSPRSAKSKVAKGVAIAVAAITLIVALVLAF